MNHKRLLREIFARALLWTGFASAARILLWRDRVAILLYHDPSAATLDQHLTYLKRAADIVPLADLEQPGNGRPRAVITLDDGHVGNAELLPIFVKHGVRPTIFLCSSIVATQREFWWQHPGVPQAGVERLKRLTNSQRIDELAALGHCIDQDARASALSAQQIEAMRPFVDFQSHTRFHPILTRCDNAQCEDEIAGSKHEIEALLQQRCEHFAYPNGNYGEREIALLKAAGYKSARTCDVGWNDRTSDPFRLRAIDIQDDSSRMWFAAQLTGLPSFLRYLRTGGDMWGRKVQF